MFIIILNFKIEDDSKDFIIFILEQIHKELKRAINNNIANKNKNALQLCPSYYELIGKLWDENGPKSFSPNNFINLIEEMRKNYILESKIDEKDESKDFIIFILEQFQKELQKSINYNINSIKEPLNQYDKKNVFNHFIDEFKENCSIISDLFFGINETTTKCLNCLNFYNSEEQKNLICYNYGIFNCLIFPLQEVKNKKNKAIQNKNILNNQKNRVSINDCLFFNEKINENNKYYCSICEQSSFSIYTTKIYVSPNILILILNRGKDNINDVKMDFTETIDISEFVLQKDIPKITYNLYGVINNNSQSGSSSHYVASCKSPVDNKWYRYNDDNVTPIIDLQKDVIDFGTPSILFYRKILNK